MIRNLFIAGADYGGGQLAEYIWNHGLKNTSAGKELTTLISENMYSEKSNINIFLNSLNSKFGENKTNLDQALYDYMGIYSGRILDSDILNNPGGFQGYLEELSKKPS